MNAKEKMVFNIGTNLVYLIINYLITFFLASYLTKKLGNEAYGFISLCNNVVNYSQIVTIALNSVAGRFITVAMHRGHKETAERYFSSNFFANLFIVAILSVIFIPLSFSMDMFFDIPAHLIRSVKLLMFLSYLNMAVSVLQTVFNVSTFITNKVYLTNIANLCGAVARLGILVSMSASLGASLAIAGAATLIGTGLVCLMHVGFTFKLVPDLKIRLNLFDKAKIIELFKSGVWNSVSTVSRILSDGLDTVISNIFVSALAMSQLSLAYMVPGFVVSAYAALFNSFSPRLTELYARSEMERFKRELKFYMKINGICGIVFFWGLLCCGKDFFTLWVPTADVDMIYQLMVLSCLSMLVSSIVNPLSMCYTIANKPKGNALFFLGVSFFDIIVELILLSTTDLGVFAVAGTSKIVSLITNFFFVPMYASYCMNFKKNEFYPVIGRYMIVTFAAGAILWFINSFFTTAINWFGFGIRVICIGTVALALGYIFVLNKQEKVMVFNMMKGRVKRK